MAKKIIFDTDLGGDCDDVMALDLFIAAHKAGECELLGVTCSWRAENAHKCVRAILKYYGMDDVPIGARPAKGKEGDIYATTVAEAFPEYAEGEAEDALALLRRLLAAQTEKVTIVATGPLCNMAELVKTDAALVAEKVEEIAVMAGNFSHQTAYEPIMDVGLAKYLADVIRDFGQETDWTEGEGAVRADGTITRLPEYNVFCDRDAAETFFELCPVPVAVSPFETGLNMFTGGPMCAAGMNKAPDSLAYVTYKAANGRDSWDPSTAYYALYGASPYLYKTCAGRVTVDKAGVTDFRPGEGRQCLLYPAAPKAEFAAAMDGKVTRLY